jgi:predicted nucleic acid-binding protein
MKVFLDANVIIAVLNREYPLFTYAARILSLNGKNGIQLFTSPLCLAISFYFATKKSGEITAKKKISLLTDQINLTSIDSNTVKKAIANQKIHDVEDGMEYYSAVNEGCTVIITEDSEDFYFSSIRIEGCEEFLLKFSTGSA